MGTLTARALRALMEGRAELLYAASVVAQFFNLYKLRWSGTMEREQEEAFKANGPATETTQKLKELRRELGDVAGSIYETAETALEDIRKNSGRTLERLYDDGRKQVRNVSRQIQDRPMRSVLLAAGAGMITGLLLQRLGARSSRQRS